MAGECNVPKAGLTQTSGGLPVLQVRRIRGLWIAVVQNLFDEAKK